MRFVCLSVCVVGFLLGASTTAICNQESQAPKTTDQVQKLLVDALKLPISDQLPAIQKALDLARSTGDRMGECRSLYSLGNCCNTLGQPDKALGFYEQALPIEREVKDSVGEERTLTGIGAIYLGVGQPDKARTYFEQVLVIAREIKDKVREGMTLNNIGIVYRRVGKLDKAKENFSLALAIAQEAKDRAGEAVALRSLGNFYFDSGQWDRALDYYSQALPIEREVKNRRNEASTLMNMGNTYGSLGHPNNALECFEAAIAIQRELNDKRGEMLTLINMGSLENSIGQLDKALAHFNQALPVQQEMKDWSTEAATLNDIALVYARMGSSEKAFDYYNQALTIRRRISDQSGVAGSLIGLGLMYSQSRQIDKALACYSEALAIHRVIKAKSEEANTLNNIGTIYLQKGDPVKALEYYNQALPVLRETKNRIPEATTLANIAAALQTLKLFQLAIVYMKQSVNVYQSLRMDTKGLPKPMQDSFTHSVERAYHELANAFIEMGRLGEATGVLNLLKDDEYFKFLRSVKPEEIDLTLLESKFKTTFDLMGEELTKDSVEFEALANTAKQKPLTQEESSRMAVLGNRLGEGRKAFQAFLRQAEVAFAKAEAKTERIDALKSYGLLASIVNKLPGHPAAIYTLVTQDAVRTILTLPNVTQLKSGEQQKIKFTDLSKKIQDLRTVLTDPSLDPVPLACQLYDLLIRPLEKSLNAANVNSLMFSLDGPLRYLPLAALYDSQTHQWLCQKYRLSLFTPANISSSRMTEAPAVKVNAEGFGVSRPHDVGGIHFPGLVGVDAELKAFSKNMGARVFEDAQFTADSLKSELTKNPTLVHLATHFELKPGDASDSFLLMGDGTPLTIADFEGWRQNVLEGVDLFVISACDTATPSGDGGEFESFSRAAQENGASAVLATLWPVDDASTGMFMSHFYELRKLHPELTKTQVLGQTQMWLMNAPGKSGDWKTRSQTANSSGRRKDLPAFKIDPARPYAHPFYWAPFVLTGNIK